ncbi:GIY-YIG nuclease family protein [Sporosarcina psychrophila]|uniref:GIY-YIG domain-containing protein n=1 Tax=Sporosarcina psychrophila TaxID=1476 RepID=A0ABV2KD21_SPOPS
MEAILLYGIIYQAVNRINGLSYIGLTKRCLNTRRVGHLYATFSKNSELYFHRAIRKYGADAFEWTEIDRADSLEELNRLESHHIKRLGTYGSNGYNLTLGGDGTSVVAMPRITRERMARSKGGRPFLVFDLSGNYVSSETIQNEFAVANDISVTNVGSVLHGRKNSIGGFILFFVAEFSFPALQTKLSRVRNVWEFDVHCVSSGELIGTWANQTHCADEIGIPRDGIGRCLTGRQKATQGYAFNYVA